MIPLFVTNILEGKPMTLFKSSFNKREWTHVEDHCRAIDLIIRYGRIGETYNVGTGVEKTVEEIADFILQTLGQGNEFKIYVSDRLQHDRRYLLDSSKLRQQLGWSPKYSFADGLRETIHWYKDNEWWWKSIKDGIKWQEYYDKKYKAVLNN
jgi:dTDP-glucose 4,6-dehydratase